MSGEDEAKLAMLHETLKEHVGLSQYEAEVYLALVRGGTQTMTDLAETSEVPKQRVYDTVSSLRDEGLVEVIDDYPRKAYAVDPSEAIGQVQEQLERAEEELEKFHETVETVESGVALFKSESTIQKYVTDLISTAERDILLLVPHDRLDEITDLLAECEDVRLRLILSDLSPLETSEDSVAIDQSLPDTVDDVRGVTSTEDFVLIADRDRALYWSRRGFQGQGDDDQAYYVSNPRLVFVLDRFVSESVWPHARSIAGWERVPSLPAEYLRIRDCLADISELAERRPIDDIEVEFDGYDTETGESVEQSGTLTSYYFTEYDVRASLTLAMHIDADTVQPTLASVGGIGAREVDYAAERIVIREHESRDSDNLTNETTRYLAECRSELPQKLGNASITVGFDAFVDRMREFVERSGDRYDRITQFERFRESLVKFEASESSPRALWRETETEPGGHVSHLGNVFGRLGYDLTLIGRFGDPIHSVFESTFSDQTLVSVGPTTSTDYVRFQNRNFLLTEPNTDPLDWSILTEQFDCSKLVACLDETEAVAIGTWWATPGLPDILEGLAEELWPRLESPPSFIHVSTGQVSELSSETIKRGSEALETLDNRVSTVVTANRDQTRQLCDALLPDSGTEASVQRLREELNVSQFVMHSLKGATLASSDGISTVSTPQIPSPRRVRNVDDHFKSGYVLGLAEGLSPEASLVLGNAIAGYFVRHDKAPDAEELRSYLADYDLTEDSDT